MKNRKASANILAKCTLVYNLQKQHHSNFHVKICGWDESNLNSIDRLTFCISVTRSEILLFILNRFDVHTILS